MGRTAPSTVAGREDGTVAGGEDGTVDGGRRPVGRTAPSTVAAGKDGGRWKFLTVRRLFFIFIENFKIIIKILNTLINRK